MSQDAVCLSLLVADTKLFFQVVLFFCALVVFPCRFFHRVLSLLKILHCRADARPIQGCLRASIKIHLLEIQHPDPVTIKDSYIQ